MQLQWWFFGPSSARRGAIDPKPPPIDSFAFMSIYKIGEVVVGVVGRPLDPKTFDSDILTE